MDHDKQYLIRDATLDDLDQLTTLHINCFGPNEHLAMLLGHSFIRDMYKWFIQSERTLCFIAISEEMIVSFATVCNGPYQKLMFTENKVPAFKAFLIRPWIIFHPSLIKRLYHMLHGPKKFEHSLNNETEVAHFSLMGVHPGFRKAGLGMIMTRNAIEKSRSKGWLKIRVVVYRNNPSSFCILEKLGFKETVFGDTKKIAMEKNLSPGGAMKI